MPSEVEELHSIAISIMENPNINVIIDNSLETAMTDFKNIFVTVQLIPQELRKFRRVVSRVLDGEVSHEAGHIVVTSPVKERLTDWVQAQANPTLANIVHQTIEDKRVNHFILLRYRFDFAHRLQLLADVSNRLWIDTLKEKVAKAKAEHGVIANNMNMKESIFLEELLISIASLEGLWGVGVEKEFDLSAEQKQFIDKTVEILDDARFDKMTMTIIARHRQLYDLWNTRVRHRSAENCPKGIGGNMKMEGGSGAKKMLAQMEKKFKKAEQQAKEELERENKKKQDEIKEGMAAGAGSGLNIPTPVPDANAYEGIVQRNREHIEKLLNLMKKLARPKLLVEKWHRQGRLMNEVLTKAYVSSIVREVDNIHARKVIKMEKTEACFGLLVDLSGSVTLRDAQDAMTVISEVLGRWLRDEDFAIIDFGSEYQKIKAFVEPYHTTRVRIGGLRCLGGTELLKPLDEMYHMLKAQRNGRSKFLVIVSDFWVNRPEECQKLLRHIEKEGGINLIGLGIDSAREENTLKFCPKQRYIGSIRELPKAVFDLYKEVAM